MEAFYNNCCFTQSDSSNEFESLSVYKISYNALKPTFGGANVWHILLDDFYMLQNIWMI